MTIKQMAAEHGVSYGAVRGRLARGYSLEEALDPNYRRKKSGFKPKMHKAYGRSQTLKEWSEETGLSYSKLQNRMRNGLTLEQAIECGEKPGKIRAYSVLYKGKRITIAALARQTGLAYTLLSYRIRKMGLSAEEAVERPVIRGGYQGRRELYANGCRYCPNCDECPFPDCRM